LCIGETAQERNSGHTKHALHSQLTTALSDLTAREVAGIVVAYEPVWAISTFDGEIAKPYDVEAAMKFIRAQIADLYSERVAKEVKILYGGSVDDTTVRGYLELESCDGVLVGGASLNPYKFANIVEAAHRLHSEAPHGE
jgi:triosephosphate isomerase